MNKSDCYIEVHTTLTNWINEGFCEVQNKYGIKYGDISPELSEQCHSLILKLSEVLLQVLVEQTKENGIEMEESE